MPNSRINKTRRAQANDPRRTIDLLDRLEPLGFDNAVFERVHHLGHGIERHRKYCDKTQEFRDDHNNARTQERLRRILEARESGDGRSFFELADAVRKEVPAFEEE